MTDHEADTRQNWKGMGGATAYHLIERHAEGWEEVDQMMNAWLRANTEELREQVAHLSLYKPARRTEQKQEPVKAIGPCDGGFWRLKHETDADLQPQKHILHSLGNRVKPRLLFCIPGIFRPFCSCLVNFSPTSILH